MAGLPVECRALQHTLAWCKEWTCWLVRFGVAVETCYPSADVSSKRETRSVPFLHHISQLGALCKMSN